VEAVVELVSSEAAVQTQVVMVVLVLLLFVISTHQ
jgi:hypothetical protein